MSQPGPEAQEDYCSKAFLCIMRSFIGWLKGGAVWLSPNPLDAPPDSLGGATPTAALASAANPAASTMISRLPINSYTTFGTPSPARQRLQALRATSLPLRGTRHRARRPATHLRSAPAVRCPALSGSHGSSDSCGLSLGGHALRRFRGRQRRWTRPRPFSATCPARSPDPYGCPAGRAPGHHGPVGRAPVHRLVPSALSRHARLCRRHAFPVEQRQSGGRTMRLAARLPKAAQPVERARRRGWRRRSRQQLLLGPVSPSRA